MKIACPCGNDISDNSDFLPNKALLIADQDRDDVSDAMMHGVEKVLGERRDKASLADAVWVAGVEAARPYERSVYQCSECGRLLLQQRGDDIHHYVSFLPEDAAAAQGILRSRLAWKWRGFLRGHWGVGSASSTGGSLWWTCGDGEGGLEELASWSDLERRYHEVFRTLRDRGVLRDSFLRKDGDMVHGWPEKS